MVIADWLNSVISFFIVKFPYTLSESLLVGFDYLVFYIVTVGKFTYLLQQKVVVLVRGVEI